MHSAIDIELPISKSIANRLLILQAIHRDELMPVSVAMPDDVRLMHQALQAIEKNTSILDLDNAGTVMRFLTAYCAQKEGVDVVLTGCERMLKRPIGQLVDVLREMGADIEYLRETGYPPLHIHGKRIELGHVSLFHPQSTQFVSALLLIGAHVTTDSESPYICMTKMVCEQYQKGKVDIEKDWSSAAFWYEKVAIDGGELYLKGLREDSMQGDKKVADIFVHLGVETKYEQDGIRIRKQLPVATRLNVDFATIPDLYPAVAIASERLGVILDAVGTESLYLKESDRIRAVREHRTDNDHRMAMALSVAGMPCDNPQCASKSYPQFMEQLCRLNA